MIKNVKRQLVDGWTDGTDKQAITTCGDDFQIVSDMVFYSDAGAGVQTFRKRVLVGVFRVAFSLLS
jgi:hypothetical protein